jgi:hypothetical protein
MALGAKRDAEHRRGDVIMYNIFCVWRAIKERQNQNPATFFKVAFAAMRER